MWLETALLALVGKRTLITRIGYSVNNILSIIFLRIACSTPPGDFPALSKLAMRRRSIFVALAAALRMGVDDKLASNAGAHRGRGEKVRNV